MVCASVALHHMFYRIIKLHFVVQIIHFSFKNILAIQLWIIYFGHQKCIRTLHFNSSIHITPEFYRNHFSHIITESVYTFAQPKQGDFFKLFPRGRNVFIFPKIKMLLMIPMSGIFWQRIKIFMSFRTHAIVYFNGLVPIILRRLRISCSITCPFCWRLRKLRICTCRLFA